MSSLWGLIPRSDLARRWRESFHQPVTASPSRPEPVAPEPPGSNQSVLEPLRRWSCS